MQGRLIPRWTPARFEQRVHETRFALVAVGRGRVQLDPGLVAWFDLTWPGQVSAGSFDTSGSLPSGFADAHFRTARGPIRMGPTGPQAGVYLFDDGMIIGVHTGVVSTEPVHDELSAFVHPKVRTGRPDTVVAITRYLSDILERKLRGASEWQSDSYTDSHAGSHTGSPPPREERPPPRPADPRPGSDHELLGVSTHVTPKELTVAYRDQVKLNHPDKVAHLSPALQRFAQQQTVALTQAYERLKASLGGR